MPNWRYLTGSSLPQLQQVWRAYGMQVQYLPGGAMIDHSEFADVIDASGHLRYVLNTDPGPATQATRSSFSVTASRRHQTGRSVHHDRPASASAAARPRLCVAWRAPRSASRRSAACASTSSPSRRPIGPPPTLFPTPLATSIQTAQGTWATVAMGHLDDPDNTFWQLFFRPAGSIAWSNQVEATATATNGGLVLARSAAAASWWWGSAPPSIFISPL